MCSGAAFAHPDGVPGETAGARLTQPGRKNLKQRGAFRGSRHRDGPCRGGRAADLSSSDAVHASSGTQPAKQHARAAREPTGAARGLARASGTRRCVCPITGRRGEHMGMAAPGQHVMGAAAVPGMPLAGQNTQPSLEDWFYNGQQLMGLWEENLF